MSGGYYSNRRLGALGAALLSGIAIGGAYVDGVPVGLRYGLLGFASFIMIFFFIDRLPEVDHFIVSLIDPHARRLRELPGLSPAQLAYAAYIDTQIEIKDRGFTIISNGRRLSDAWVMRYLKKCRNYRELPSLNKQGNQTTSQMDERAMIAWMMGRGRQWVAPVAGGQFVWTEGHDANKVIEFLQVLAGERLLG